MQCPSCSCNEIEYNDASGEAVCINCGTVLEENGIVSSIEFAESASGSASVIGQYVSSTSGNAFGPVAPSGRHFSRESREATLMAGRQKISQLAGQLHLGAHYIDSAHRLFMMALQRNFTSGRKSQNVIAACLYVVCRREKSPHLLIDFSDRLQTNVFVLGSVFLKFCHLLNLTLPIIDPSLYIHRFAAQLNLGPKTHVIATTALRLVATMKRDWLEVGRRPSGICGAALLIAAKTHDVECTRASVKNVVQISDHTLCKRLHEFSLTPAAQLTFEEFGRITFQVECDPPVFRKHQERKVLQRIEQQSVKKIKDTEENEDGVCPLGDIAISNMLSVPNALPENAEDYGFENEREWVASKAVTEAARTTITRLRIKSENWCKKRKDTNDFYASIERDLKSENGSSAPAKIKGLPNSEKPEQRTDDEEDTGNLSDLDDEDIDSLLLSEEEVKRKTVLWLKMNETYLKEQAEKEAHELATGKPATTRRRRKSAPESQELSATDTAHRAIKKLKGAKKMSRNINYDVLAELLGPS